MTDLKSYNICNVLDIFTVIEGDFQLGRLSRVLGLGRAGNRISGSIVTKLKKEIKTVKLENNKIVYCMFSLFHNVLSLHKIDTVQFKSLVSAVFQS